MVEQLVAELRQHLPQRVRVVVDVLETALNTVRFVAEGLLQALLAHRMARHVVDPHPFILSVATDSPALRTCEQTPGCVVVCVVVEVGVARDAAGRWRHPARWHRARAGLSPADVPRTTMPA
jgi:hypothetical protein